MKSNCPEKQHSTNSASQMVLLRRPRAPAENKHRRKKYDDKSRGCFVNYVNYNNNKSFDDDFNSINLSAGIQSEDKILLNPSQGRSKGTPTNDNEMLGNYVENRVLMKPLRVKGPEAFPARQPKHRSAVENVQPDKEMKRYYKPSDFTFQDFVIKLSDIKQIPLENCEKVMYSKTNYRNLQKMLFEKCNPKSDGCLHTVELQLPDNIPVSMPRVPTKQLLFEMAAVIKEEVSKTVGIEVKSVINRLPCKNPFQSGPLAEILLYEDHQSTEKKQQLNRLRSSELPGRASLVSTSASRYFHGSKRSSSPFDSSDAELISPSEVAILDCLLNGAKALSFKAHFISVLPDIRPIQDIVTYLNLSFNNFETLPAPVLDLTHLSILKLRNNPISKLPEEISRLEKLRILVVSFCLLSVFPSHLSALTRLEHLDISYNKISFIPSKISEFRKLKELNVAGNQLLALPASMLKMSVLTDLQVKNNLMHPIFWQEFLANPSAEFDDELDFESSDSQESQNKSLMFCDCCGGQRSSSSSVQIIRPVEKLFGVRNLPLFFKCCSPDCLDKFMSNGEDLMKSLYRQMKDN